MKAFLSDLDGTLTHPGTDIIDELCAIVGKKAESEASNLDFLEGRRRGVDTLVERVTFLDGLPLSLVHGNLSTGQYLQQGTLDLFRVLKNTGVVTVLQSGNITPVVLYYKQILDIDFCFGTDVRVDDDMCLLEYTQEEADKRESKHARCDRLLRQLGIQWSDAIAFGDSPGDRQIMEAAGFSIAINPRGGIEEHADCVVHDVRDVLTVMRNLGMFP